MRNESKSRRANRKAGERGFALLVVFLIAAGIMISLYIEIPRVAFESQRNREEMLIERGEQYSRAIEVFYRKNKRYPSKLEDLENFNNLRFLRKRYKDPLTGKDEWRIIHMGPAGQLADSLIEKPGQQPGQQLAGVGTSAGGAAASAGQTAGAATGASAAASSVPGAPPGPEDVNVAMNRVRPSDRNPGGRPAFGPGTPGFDPNNPNAQLQQQVDANGNPIVDPNNPGPNPNGQQPDPNNPQPFNPNNPNGQNVFTQAGQQGQPGQPGYNPNFPLSPNFPGVQQPGFQNQPGVNPNGVQPGTPGQPVFYQNGQPFSPGGQLQGQLAAQNGQNPNQAGFGQNPALNAINNQLRNPNGFGSTTGVLTGPPPGGPSTGLGGPSGFGGPSNFGTAAQTSPQTGQSFGGAGIAGVASNQVGVGIKRYNDRQKYKEWEFVFDYRKPKTKPTTGVTGLKLNDITTPKPDVRR